MIQVDIPATKRTVFGKCETRRLRMVQKTPAIMYSKGEDGIALQFDEAVLYKDLLFIHGRNAVVTLDIEGDDRDKRHVLVQEIQKHPVVERVLHVDFLEIELDKEINFDVAIRLTGEAKGVELGGRLQVPRQYVTLRGLPLDVPDEIVADITELETGHKGISCADLDIPANITMLDDPATVCVRIVEQ